MDASTEESQRRPLANLEISLMQVENRAGLGHDELSELQNQIGRFRTVEQILHWGFAPKSGCQCPQVIKDLIVQDEFNFDLIVPWGPGYWLVFRAT